MCGIAGFLGEGDRADLERMTNRIPHRWPDADGFFVKRSLHLSHCPCLSLIWDGILPKVDRASMIHGLKARSSFLDIEVTDFTRRLPHFKLCNGVTKYLLKKTLELLLSHDIICRKKKGFGTPVGAWFRTGWLAPPSRSPFSVQKLAAHHAGKIDERLYLWCRMCLDEWGSLLKHA